MEGGIWSSFFFRQIGLIAWLRESMSGRNPSSRSDSPKKCRKSSLFFRLMFDAQERPF